MDRFLTEKTSADSEIDLYPAAKRLKTSILSSSATSSSSSTTSTTSASTSKMKKYKQKLTYQSIWKKKDPWVDYVSTPSTKGMICTVCPKHGKVPAQTKGAWVTKPIDNWIKAATLLKNHQQSEWHIAAIEKNALLESSQKSSDVMDLIVSASEEEKRQNRELLKKLIRSLYFLVKHPSHSPYYHL